MGKEKNRGILVLGKIQQDTIDEIRNSAEILEVVSEYVELRRRGRNYFGLCPFHPEKTPSFSVAPDKQIYHCFGCGAGGNAISFIMEYEKISFVDSLKKLAEMYSVKLNLKNDDNAGEFFSQLYEVHSEAVTFFKKNLKSSGAKNIREYLNSRGLTDETVETFDLGYSGEGWDHLLSVIKKRKIPQEIIEKCGLFTKTEKGVFDRFRNRLMFPITNRGNRVVGFGGRDMSGKNNAKYLNSPETPIYKKSELLYGLSHTHNVAREERSYIIVEGYMDFLQLYQHGIKNIAASSGTALTSKQVTQIRKFADTVYLAYDGDDAGRKATITAGYNLLKEGVAAKIVNVPEGKDPDSWINDSGTDSFRQGQEDATDVVSFHFQNTPLNISNAIDRSRLAGEIADEIASINDEIIRRELVKQVAEKMAVDENVIIQIVKKSRRHNKPWKQNNEKPEIDISSPTVKAEQEIVKLLASSNENVVSLLIKNTDLSNFSDPMMKVLAKYFIESRNSDGNTNLSGALDLFQEKIERERVSSLLLEDENIEDEYHVAVDCLITLEQRPLKTKIDQERIRLRDMERSGKDSSEAIASVMELREQVKQLEYKRKSLLKASKQT